jgi:hypothetical protein
MNLHHASKLTLFASLLFKIRKCYSHFELSKFESWTSFVLHRFTFYHTSFYMFALSQAPKAQRESRGIALIIRDLGARRGWVLSTTPRPLYTRYPLYRRLGGPQGRSGRARKISPQPGLDPRTVQPVAIPYYDSTIPVPHLSLHRGE